MLRSLYGSNLITAEAFTRIYPGLMKSYDGDLGVYRHDNAKTKADVDELINSNKNSSGGGEKMGETKYWDEFLFSHSHALKNEFGAGPYRILFNQSWDKTIQDKFKLAKSMAPWTVANSSKNSAKHGQSIGRNNKN